MADNKAYYTGSDDGSGHYKVVFVNNSTKARLVRSFDSPYLARKFVNKLKHSTRCTLVSSPIFN